MVTPSHGGTVVGGHEFDLPISQPQQPASDSSDQTAMPTASQTPTPAQVPAPAMDQLSPLPSATPRSPATSKPRPVSMPPQSAFSSDAADATDIDPSNSDDPAVNPEVSSLLRLVDESRYRHTSRRSSNKILNEYILSKTLGAGSMGKVKLATHSKTGEKVCTF